VKEENAEDEQPKNKEEVSKEKRSVRQKVTQKKLKKE
jgi:hypothetical protein